MPDMTAKEALAAAGRGERVGGPHSRHAAAGPPCPGFNCAWRVLFCDGDRDVVECRRCGRQAVTRCDSDDEYA